MTILFESRLSYARLVSEVDALAGYLESCGVQRGDSVILLSQNCSQFLIAFYAIVRAGACVVPVNVMSTVEVTRHYIEDSLSVSRMGLTA